MRSDTRCYTHGNHFEHAIDILSIEKVKGIRVNDLPPTMFVGDYLQQWIIMHGSYGPPNDEWSFTQKYIDVVENGDLTSVLSPGPVVMYDLVLKKGDEVLKFTDLCPPEAVIVALGSHEIVKARSLTSGGVENCITVRTTSKLEPNLLNDLLFGTKGSMFLEVNHLAKLPEIASNKVEDRIQFYENHHIMLLALGNNAALSSSFRCRCS